MANGDGMAAIMVGGCVAGSPVRSGSPDDSTESTESIE